MTSRASPEGFPFARQKSLLDLLIARQIFSGHDRNSRGFGKDVASRIYYRDSGAAFCEPLRPGMELLGIIKMRRPGGRNMR